MKIVVLHHLLLCILVGLAIFSGCNEAVEATSFPARSNSMSDATYFFQLAMAIPRPQNLRNDTKVAHVHLIRIPKASSTSMSVVARRMAGCLPPGPCCKYPGDPEGTCPDRRLYDCKTFRKVIGCTGHHGDLLAMRSSYVPSISMLRHPLSRSISAFQYPGMHHNSDCKGSQMTCFEEYLTDKRWSNVALKMLVGDFAYANVQTCNRSTECKHSLQSAVQNFDKLTFMGVSEVWELSLLVLHYIFPQLHPEESEFAAGSHVLSAAVRVSRLLDSEGPSGQRVNNQSEYFEFSKHVRKVYKEKLLQQNQYDLMLYEHALQWMCRQLHRRQLWPHDSIQAYWKQRIPHPPPDCS